MLGTRHPYAVTRDSRGPGCLFQGTSSALPLSLEVRGTNASGRRGCCHFLHWCMVPLELSSLDVTVRLSLPATSTAARRDWSWVMSFGKTLAEAGGRHVRGFQDKHGVSVGLPIPDKFWEQNQQDAQGLWSANPSYCLWAPILSDSHQGIRVTLVWVAHLLSVTIPVWQQLVLIANKLLISAQPWITVYCPICQHPCVSAPLAPAHLCTKWPWCCLSDRAAVERTRGGTVLAPKDSRGEWCREACQGLVFSLAKEARRQASHGPLLLKTWGMSARWAFYFLILTPSTQVPLNQKTISFLPYIRYLALCS